MPSRCVYSPRRIGVQKTSSVEVKSVQDEQLNFEATAGVIEKSEEQPSAHLLPDSVARGLSVGVSFILLICSWIVARKLVVRQVNTPNRAFTNAGSHWHLLSLLISSFLALNLFFGGMNAFLLGRTSEDARAYFSEISTFKLSKLSHEHFFGYGISFGLIAALSFVFVSHSKMRVMLPSALLFLFGALDVTSWWLTHSVSFGFHTLSYLTGTVLFLSFLSLYLQVCFAHIIHFIALSKKDSL